MTFALSGAIAGATATGFTAPTYTVTTDKAPDVNGVQYAVTALGGTQAGVRSHAVSDPFTITVMKPKNPRALPSPNPTTGKYGQVPNNRFGFILRKGVNFAANNAPAVLISRQFIDVPAGSDAYDAPNVRAAVSFYIGALTNQAAGIGDTLCTGIL